MISIYDYDDSSVKFYYNFDFFMVLVMVGVENFIVYSMMYLLLKVNIVYLLVVTPILEKSF